MKYAAAQIRLLALTTCLCASVGAPAFAQLSLPGSVEPGRIEKNMQAPDLPSTMPDFTDPDAPPPLDTSVPHADEGFVLKAVTVTGSTVISNTEFDALFDDVIGTEVNLQSLRAIANRATELYRAKGYFLSKVVVPEQDARDGSVVLAAIEGYISSVEVHYNGKDAETDDTQLHAMREEIAPRILALKPLHGPSLQNILLRLDDLGGVDVNTIIKPLPANQAKPGAVGIDVVVRKTKPRFTIGADNYGSRFSGPGQARAGAVVSPGLVDFDKLSVVGLTSVPLDEVSYVSANYEVPLNYSGTQMGITAGYSNSVPGYSLKVNDIESDAINLEWYVRHPWLRTRELSISNQLSFDYKNIDSDISTLELYTDRIRALRLSGDVDFNDSWMGINTFNATLSQGLNILDATKTGSLNLSRAEGKSDFTKLEFSASRLQRLSSTWQLYAGVSGQYTNDPLLSTEEFGYGGQSFGRAYDPSEIIGDQGIAGVLEARYYGIDPVYDISISPFAFYDVGRVWNLDVGSEDHDSGASAGIGVRLWHPTGISSTVGLAMPLTKDVNTPLYSHSGRDPRLLLEVQYGF